MLTNDFVNFEHLAYGIYFQYALPHLRKTKGNIIQDSSLVAEIGQPGAVPYVATKVRLQQVHKRN